MLIHCVGDIIRAKASLQVTCLNCQNNAFIKGRFLMARYGYGMPLESLKEKFRCSRCHRSNVRFGIAPADLGETKLRAMTWFGGVYQKLED